MPKKSKPPRPSATTPIAESELITLSTRLTAEQRDRIAKAAERKGWTPTNLIRIAALEKSAHILNTTTRNKIDFSNLASRIATQLLEASAELYGENGPLTDEEEMNMHLDIEAVPSRFSSSDVESLRSAAQYGGAEFLNMIVDFCEGLVARDRGSLPDPVEPIPLAVRGEESGSER